MKGDGAVGYGLVAVKMNGRGSAGVREREKGEDLHIELRPDDFQPLRSKLFLKLFEQPIARSEPTD